MRTEQATPGADNTSDFRPNWHLALDGKALIAIFLIAFHPPQRIHHRPWCRHPLRIYRPDTANPAATPPNPATEAPVLPPNAAQGDPIPKPTDGVRRPAQQSDDKPMPGQNNDHSAPLTPSR